MNEVSIAEINAYLQAHLSEKRLRHVEGVRRTAIALCRQYGEDEKRAELAALFHDMYRELDGEELKATVRALALPKRYGQSRNLAHSKIAAAKMRADWGVDDADMLQAVSYHTTGRPGMSRLEKILYLADAIEPGRDYPGVATLRELAFQDLDRACLLSLTNTIAFVQRQGSEVDDDSVRAKAYFEKIIKEKER